jgi:hypothetical protein
MATEFIPYWLIHEPGKTHGFAIVALDSAITAEKALEVFRESDDAKNWLKHGIDYSVIELESTLITKPFVP